MRLCDLVRVRSQPRIAGFENGADSERQDRVAGRDEPSEAEDEKCDEAVDENARQVLNLFEEKGNDGRA